MAEPNVTPEVQAVIDAQMPTASPAAPGYEVVVQVATIIVESETDLSE